MQDFTMVNQSTAVADVPDFPNPAGCIEAACSNYAIQIDSLWKRYGKSRVLSGLTLQVPMGKIYGLLGPSGCGKTTLLKCAVGRIAPDSGLIRVMGQRPGKLGHRVPGRLVGYMPQDIALYQEFTIREILYFFGRLFCMTAEDIETQINFLTSLLSLPSKGKLISKLSGGQQRRVSFACALLHKPPLLILDEPTVGVDPLLRQCIWYHLQAIVADKEQPRSVLITTHYIEEARQSHLVALMRDGKLLAEASPDSLLNLYKETTLEAVFLLLCRQHQTVSAVEEASDAPDSPAAVAAAASREEEATDVKLHDTPASFAETALACLTPPSPRRVAAIAGKSFTNLRRRPSFLAFQISLPILQIVLFCLCIGGEPYGLRLATVNLDVPPASSEALGEKFIRHLDAKTFAKTSFPDLQSARAEVRATRSWAVVSLSPNFTSCLWSRLLSPATANNDILRDSSVHLQLDNSNYQVSSVVRQHVAVSFQSFIADLLQERGLNPVLASLPLRIDPPLLGSENPSFTEFMAPGMIVTIVFFMATGLTALSFVLERKEGLLDRSLVAGVTIYEVMLGHMLTEFVIMACQTGVLLVFSLAVFRIPCHGSVALVLLLALMSGFTGMSLGLLVSVLCTAETPAIQVCLGTMYPNLLLSGIIWPAEAMPVFLRHVSKFLPSTLVVEAMRSVMSRGFGMTAPSVYLGLTSSLVWSTVLLLISLIMLKFRSFR